MSDYDAEYERQRQIDEEYVRTLNEYNRAVEYHNRLVVDVARAQEDVFSGIDVVRRLHDAVQPHLENTAVNTDKEQVVAENVSRTIDDLVDSYRLLKNGSTASKNLTGDYDKYNVRYGLYNELRQVALGYVVGLDANIWKSDEPRQKVEKMYLANTDYWLAYATMAVMLWASDEREACERAVFKSMQINERKSALFFLLASLRFDRIEAAREWYRVYFDLVDGGGVGEEIIYILQVLLCGALGADAEFARAVQEKIRSLLEESNRDPASRRAVQEAVDGYFDAYISVTRKEFVALKHICPEYDDMMSLLSDAEKNAKLRDYFKSVISEDAPLSDRLAERIEDALYALISSNDDAEQELLDKIAYEEMVVKANGRIDEAKASFDNYLMQKAQNRNLALIMTNSALGADSKADSRVKKFALSFIRKEAVAGAEKYAGYREREKAVYDYAIDGCKLSGDENSFGENKPKLLKHYDGLIKARIKEDKQVSLSNKLTAIFAVMTALFAVLTVVGFVVGWKTSASVTLLMLALVAAGAAAGLVMLGITQREKIRRSFDYRIENGVKMLETGLKDLAGWRAAYREADSVYDELLKVLKEVNANE
ncbi:MAG: hypothetical protein HFK09_07070 [Clostridia bacterium]|nr:hypothetical protein [Clostridia bacterium]